MKRFLHCVHCAKDHPWESYADHVKGCILLTMLLWDEAEYSKTYFKQVRAMSRYRQPGDPRRRRSLFRAWSWAAVHPEGPPLMAAEVATS